MTVSRVLVPRAALLLALLLPLSMLTAVLTPTVAEAYTPASIPRDAVVNPTVTTAITHTLDGGASKPAKGMGLTYAGTVTVGSLRTSAGASNTVTVQFCGHLLAPFDSAVTASDVTVTGGRVTAVTMNGACAQITVVTDAGASSASIAVSKHARIASDAPDDAIISASINAQVVSRDGVQLGGPGYTGFTADGAQACSGVANFEYKTASGGWLADIKFADAQGLGKVIPDTVPLVSLADNPSATNGIQVLDGAGKDITNAVLGRMASYNPADSSWPMATSPNAYDYPNAVWKDSLNWNFDASTYTGDTWLPAGATIKLRRHVRYGQCVLGLSTDLTAGRPLAANLTITMPDVQAESGAVDSVSVPDTYVPPEFCRAVYSSSTGTSLSVGVFSDNNGALTYSKDVTATNNYGAEAIAVSGLGKLSGRYYYMPRPSAATFQRQINYADSTGKVTVVTTTLPVGGAAAAIDGSGFFWWVSEKANVLYKIDLQPNGATNSVGASPTAPALTLNLSSPVYDIAFDGSGNLWMVDSGNRIYMVTKAQLEAGGTVTPAQVIPAGTDPSRAHSATYYGMAFASNGDLLLGASDGWIYRVTSPTSSPTWQSAVAATWNTHIIQDLASCTPPAVSSTPSYVVQKSAIDPATGAIVAPGTTSPSRVTIDAQGQGRATYVVTVANTGVVPGNPGTITDTFTAPAGVTVNKVTVDGQDRGAGTSLQLIPGELAAGQARSFRVTVSFTVDRGSADWSVIGACATEGGGTPGRGLFNRVDMANDADGADNNDACVPVDKPGARLTLVKQIVDQNGAVLDSADTRYFTLSAFGASGFTGTTGTGRDVYPGSYSLSEASNSVVNTATYAFGTTWTCDSGKAVTGNAVEIAAGDNVTCTIRNTRTPRFHVVKNATTPAGDNAHIGTTVVLDAKGAGTLSYTIEVTNDSGFAGTTGKIIDTFLVPAGLVWDGSKTAAVSYDDRGTGARAVSLATALTKEQLSTVDAGVLASAVGPVPAGGTVAFTVTIPVAADSAAGAQGGTVFDDHAANLGACESATSPGGHKYAQRTRGVLNGATLWNENTAYTDVPVEDNIACIPVIRSGGVAWTKVDAAQTSTLLTGTEWKIADADGKSVTIGGTTLDRVTDCTAGPCSGPDTDPKAGSFAVLGLTPGSTYTLTETKAPFGYLLSKDTYTFVPVAGRNVVPEGTGVVEGAIPNTKIPSVEIPLTGGLGSDWVRVGGGLLLCAALSVGLLYRRSRRRAPIE